jgi:hypothetical protein
MVRQINVAVRSEVMSDFNPFYDYSKRSYLLPPGCKDLIDVLEKSRARRVPSAMSEPMQDDDTAVDKIAIPDEIMVRELARLIGHKPFRIIAVLMQFGIFANPQQSVDFKTASRVLRKFGYIPIKVV